MLTPAFRQALPRALRFPRLSDAASPRARLIWLVLAIGLSAGLAWGYRDELPQLLDRLGQVQWWLVPPALLLLGAVEFAKALRWQVLYGANRPPYRAVLQATLLGQATNALSPLRIGEPLALLWAGPSRGELARGTVALVLVKGVDAVILATLAAWLVGSWFASGAGTLLAGASLLLALTAVLVARRLSPTVFAGAGRVRRVLTLATRYAQELNAQTAIAVFGTSAVAWGAGLFADVLVLAAVGLAPSLDLGLRMLAAGYIAGLLPGPPARIGVYEAAVAGALISGGASLEAAIGAALLLHALKIVKVAVLAAAATRWR